MHDVSVSHWSICGLGLDVLCEASDSTRIVTVLRQFLAIEPAPSRPGSLTIDLGQNYDEPPLGARDAAPLVDWGGLRVSHKDQRFYLSTGDFWLESDIGAGRARGGLAPSFWECPRSIQRDLFVWSLVLLARTHGRWALHANGLVKSAGILVVGPPGHGKTTLSLSLLTSGWKYVSDDVVMLTCVGRDVHALALRRSFALTTTTLRSFPGLAGLDPATDARDGKLLTNVDHLFPESFTPTCVPRVIAFPSIEDSPRTTVRTVEPARAISVLIEQSGMPVVTDPENVKAQLDTLSQLVRQTRAFDFRLGRDVFDDPARVAELIEGLG